MTDKIDRMILTEVGRNPRVSSLNIARKLQGLGYSLNRPIGVKQEV